MNIRILAPLFVLFLTGYNAIARAFIVHNNEEVYTRLPQLQRGDSMLLADGAYQNIQLIVKNSGKAGSPIVIGALHPGQVFFTGDVKVELRGSYIELSGIYFKDGNRDIAKWKSHGPGLVAIYGSYNRITQCVFNNFDEANSAYITTSLDENGKVPQHCRIDHCSFTNKLTFDQVINLNNTSAPVKTGIGGPPMYHRVDHCFFSNPKKAGNAGGGIRIGYYRNDTGRCLVDSNIFMRQDSEPEIITSKSRENVFYANTIVNCQGTLNFRHGDKQVALHNIFMGTDSLFGYGGMFIWGSDHIIANNYFNLPATIQSRGYAALYLNPGARGTEHALTFHILIANNQFINNNGYAVHLNPLAERRQELTAANKELFELPQDILFAGNVFYSNTRSYSFFKDDYANSRRNNRWLKNAYAGSVTGLPSTPGLEKMKLKIQNGKLPFVSIQPVPGISLLDTFYDNIEGVPLNFSVLMSRPIDPRPLNAAEILPEWMIQSFGSYCITGKLTKELSARLKRINSRTK